MKYLVIRAEINESNFHEVEAESLEVAHDKVMESIGAGVSDKTFVTIAHGKYEFHSEGIYKHRVYNQDDGPVACLWFFPRKV